LWRKTKVFQLPIDHFIAALNGRERPAQSLAPIVGTIPVGHLDIHACVEKNETARMLNEIGRHGNLDALACIYHGRQKALVELELTDRELPHAHVRQE